MKFDPNRQLPVVSWAGPLERATRHLTRAGEAFEAHRYDVGLDELKQLQDRINEAVEFILRTAP